jgi:hypothetical protein
MLFSASILLFSQSMMPFGVYHHLSAYMFEGKVCVYFKQADSLDFFGIITSTVLCHLLGEYPVLRGIRVKIQSMVARYMS